MEISLLCKEGVACTRDGGKDGAVHVLRHQALAYLPRPEFPPVTSTTFPDSGRPPFDLSSVDVDIWNVR